MTTENRAEEALAHVQTAALELIAAARAFLDVAEDLVKEPAELATVVARARRATATESPDGPPVEHIRVD
jgi:hypothetical protein